MNVDRDEPICGVRPASLKHLLRNSSFTTLQAMRLFGLNEPEISRTMLLLSAEGWIEYVATEAFIDHWRTTPQGLRLTATRLMKRFPIEEGRQVVEQVIEKARAINAIPDISHRITEIILFGSVLTGIEGEDVGDVDLVVAIAPRQLPKQEMARIKALEDDATPRGLNFLVRLGWSRCELMRQLKGVSSRISFHSDSDLSATGAPFATVFRYDIKSE